MSHSGTPHGRANINVSLDSNQGALWPSGQERYERSTEQITVRICGCLPGFWLYGWLAGWVDGRTDGWMDGWTDGQTDIQRNGRID